MGLAAGMNQTLRARAAAAGAAFASNAANSSLRRAQLSFLAAWTAEWAFTVGLGVVAYRAGGPTAVGLVGLLRMAPSALVAPLVAPLADRGRRERVLVLVSMARGVTTGSAALVVALDGPVGIVYLLAVLSTFAATLYRPAHSALLPSLCRTGHELASANVVRGMLDSIATLIGPLIAAWLLGISGAAGVFAFASAASLAAGAVLVGIHYDVAPRPAAPGRGHLMADVAQGVRALAGSRDLALLTGLTMAQTFTRGALTVFTVVVALDLLGTGEPGVGTLTGAVGAGAVIGSLLASLLVGSERLARWFGVGVALWGLPLVLIPVFPQQATAFALLAVVGIGNALVDVGVFTLMARLAPDEILARVFGLFESLLTLAIGLGALTTSLLIEWTGLPVALVTVGALCPSAVLLSWRRLRFLDRQMAEFDTEISLLRRVPMLGPLPLPAIEQLARCLVPVRVAAGRAVFRQGDPADRLYVIRHGRATVVGDGEAVATLGPGEGFGEIALLRRVPRTATVRAMTELEMLALGGDRFLPIVTGFPPSARQAGAEVEALLDRFRPGGRVADPGEPG